MFFTGKYSLNINPDVSLPSGGFSNIPVKGILYLNDDAPYAFTSFDAYWLDEYLLFYVEHYGDVRVDLSVGSNGFTFSLGKGVEITDEDAVNSFQELLNNHCTYIGKSSPDDYTKLKNEQFLFVGIGAWAPSYAYDNNYDIADIDVNVGGTSYFHFIESIGEEGEEFYGEGGIRLSQEFLSGPYLFLAGTDSYGGPYNTKANRTFTIVTFNYGTFGDNRDDFLEWLYGNALYLGRDSNIVSISYEYDHNEFSLGDDVPISALKGEETIFNVSYIGSSVVSNISVESEGCSNSVTKIGDNLFRVFLSNIVGDITIRISQVLDYNGVINLTTNNCYSNEFTNRIFRNGSDVTIYLYPNFGYKLPENVLVSGIGYSWYPNEGVLVLEASTINSTQINVLVNATRVDIPDEPVGGGFNVNLYKNSAPMEQVDKSAKLSYVDTVSGVLKAETSVVDVVLDIEYQGFPEFNYMYIPMFNRWYYVNDIIMGVSGIITVRGHVDVLMTYKNDINNSSAYVTRNANTYEPDIIDNSRVMKQGVTTYVYNGLEPIAEQNMSGSSARFILSGPALSIGN